MSEITSTPPAAPSPIPPEPPEPQLPPGDAEALPAGHRIEEFEVQRVLGSGGFGIVYLALDHMLHRQVAMKEYLPATMAGREAGGAVAVRSQRFAASFGAGLDSFINEARLLARFDHPALVKVHRFWRGNGTAYMVMPYYEGRTLKQVRRSMDMAPDPAWLQRVLDNLLGALETLHAADVYHRDVAPDNILLLPSGLPVLLDFGAARHLLIDQTRTLTAVLKPTYAPIEQYAEAAELRQGPWTDIYASAATLYFCLTGHAPPSAVARVVQDELRPLHRREELLHPTIGQACDAHWLAALDWGLAVKPQARPQSIAAWREALQERAPEAPPAAQAEQPSHDRPSHDRPSTDRPSSTRWRWVGVGLAMVLAAAGLFFSLPTPTDPPPVAVAPAASAVAAQLPSVPVPIEASLAAPLESLLSDEAKPVADSASPAATAASAAAVETALPAALPTPVPPTSATRPPHDAAPAPRRAQPVRVASAPGPASPRELCGNRFMLGKLFCMKQACDSARWATHPQCVEWHEMEQRGQRDPR